MPESFADFLLNRVKAERQALAHRLRYHLCQVFLTEDFELVTPYADLLHQLARIDLITHLVIFAAQMKTWVAKYYATYLKKRYGFQ